MNRIWFAECEFCDFCVERCTFAGHHLISAAHRPERGREWTSGRILKGLAWRQDRLVPDDTGALDFLNLVRAVGDDPVPTDELDRLDTLIHNAYGVGEKPLISLWFRVRKLSGDRDSDSLGDCLRGVHTALTHQVSRVLVMPVLL